MSEPTFDADGYPTEATLRAVRRWPVKTPDDCTALLAYVGRAWHWPDMFQAAPRLSRPFRGSRTLERRYRLVTGGWSGNESLVAALDGNRMFTMLCWRESHRGGLHVYAVPERIEEPR